MELGKKLVKIRKDNNLTQEDFAEKYNVTRQTISSWENSKSYPDLETLVKISDDFDITVEIDEDGNYIPFENEDQEKLKSILDDNRNEINKLFDLANKMWDLK